MEVNLQHDIMRMEMEKATKVAAQHKSEIEEIKVLEKKD
jgi:hypothetical protein